MKLTLKEILELFFFFINAKTNVNRSFKVYVFKISADGNVPRTVILRTGSPPSAFGFREGRHEPENALSTGGRLFEVEEVSLFDAQEQKETMVL